MCHPIQTQAHREHKSFAHSTRQHCAPGPCSPVCQIHRWSAPIKTAGCSLLQSPRKRASSSTKICSGDFSCNHGLFLLRYSSPRHEAQLLCRETARSRRRGGEERDSAGEAATGRGALYYILHTCRYCLANPSTIISKMCVGGLL